MKEPDEDDVREAGQLFAMLVRGELVVKLPKARVDQLVETGAGVHFERGQAR